MNRSNFFSQVSSATKTQGSSVTQLTSKATGVTIDAPSGVITTAADSLSAGAEITFVVTCARIVPTDCPYLVIASGAATPGTYAVVCVGVVAGSFTVAITNLGNTASEALVLNYVIL